MQCPTCRKEIIADRLFCNWCETYVPNPSSGRKASVIRRFAANFLDQMILTVLTIVVFGALLSGKGAGIMLFIWLVAFGVSLYLFSQGKTLGKHLMGEQVVGRSSGTGAGFGRMLVRETVGKWVSALFFGLGFFWAIWDKDSQAWHDKMVGTVVVKAA